MFIITVLPTMYVHLIWRNISQVFSHCIHGRSFGIKHRDCAIYVSKRIYFYFLVFFVFFICFVYQYCIFLQQFACNFLVISMIKNINIQCFVIRFSAQYNPIKISPFMYLPIQYLSDSVIVMVWHYSLWCPFFEYFH